MPSTPWILTEAHLDSAIAAVRDACSGTPLVPAPKVAPRVWLKVETEQPTGAFKVRGALAKLASLGPDERARGVIAASAGNHGLGVAWAGKRLGIRVTVVVPESAPRVKRDGIRALGAEVLTAAGGYDDAEVVARERSTTESRTFVSPYDDPFVAAGNGGTLGVEILRALPHASAIVTPIGGGGLAIGLAAARRREGAKLRIVGVQSEACPAMVRSLAEGRALERFEGAPTLAEGLEGGVSSSAFELVRREVDEVTLVSELAIAMAMRFAKRELGRTLEGSAAVALAWAIDNAEKLPGDGPVVVILTGQNVDPGTLARVLS